MELAQLEAFLQVAHHRSFSRAAEALFLTQPSVTARIQSLERELGERLFERSGRTVTLTDAGLAFLPHAQRALTAVQEGADAIDAVRHGDVGNIRLGASPSIGTYVLPTLLKRFRERRPRVHVHLVTGQSEAIIEQLLTGVIHLAVCRLSTHPELESVHLYNDDLVLVVAPDHPFAKRNGVTLAEAGREPFLFFEKNSSYYTLVLSVFLRAGVSPESTIELDSFEAMKRLVEAGLGITLIPAVAVRHELEEGRLASVPITDMEQPPQREVGIHFLRNRRFSPPVREFLDLVLSHFGAQRRAGR